MDFFDLLVRGVFLTSRLIELLKMRDIAVIRVSVDLGLIFLGLIVLSTVLNVRRKKGFWLGVAGLGISSFFIRSKVAGGILSLLFMAKFWKSVAILIIALFLIYQGLGDLLMLAA